MVAWQHASNRFIFLINRKKCRETFVQPRLLPQPTRLYKYVYCFRTVWNSDVRTIKLNFGYQKQWVAFGIGILRILCSH